MVSTIIYRKQYQILTGYIDLYAILEITHTAFVKKNFSSPFYATFQHLCSHSE